MNNNGKNKNSGSSKLIKILCAAAVITAMMLSLFVMTGCQQNGGDDVTTDEEPEVTKKQNNSETSTGTETDLQITAVQDGEVKAGETVTVKIKLTNVTELASLALTATWDDELKLIDASYGPEFSGGLRHTPDMDEEDGGWAGVKCPFTFNWVALTETDAVFGDCTYITAHFETNENKPGTYHFSLKANPDNIFDCSDENVPYVLTSAEIVVSPK